MQDFFFFLLLSCIYYDTVDPANLGKRKKKKKNQRDHTNFDILLYKIGVRI